jgi:lipopolysaccharide/colanic/teichoic acid biosynthesis glycosyltransferase
MANGLVRELREVKPPEAAPLPARDVRAPEGSILRGRLIRWETFRRLLRVIVLSVGDAAGVFLAIWTALELKAAIRTGGSWETGFFFDQTKDFAPLACLVTVLLFARSDLYADRTRRPGFARIVAALFQVAVVILAYTVVQGMEFSSYYIFYGSLLFALFYISAFRWAFDRVSGMLLRAAGYRRRAVLVGTGSQIEAVAHALGGGQHPQVDPVGFVSLTPRPENGLKDLGPLEELENHFTEIDEVLIADPAFPQEQAVDLVDRCHRHGIKVCVAPSTMEILMDRVEFIPGQTLPLFELKPPVFEGIDFFVKRSFDVVVSSLLILLSAPVMLMSMLAIKLSSRGPVVYRSMRPGIGGEPFACLKFRTMYTDADERQAELEAANEKGGALFKIRNDPRVTPRRALPAALVDRRAAAALQRAPRRDVARRPAPASAARLRPARGLAPQAQPRAAGHHGPLAGLGPLRARLRRAVRLDFLYLERWSVFLDLTILLKTIPRVIRARGAW